MATTKNYADTLGANMFQNDVLSFEELQKLEDIKEGMLKGDYYTFNEIFHAV